MKQIFETKWFDKMADSGQHPDDYSGDSRDMEDGTPDVRPEKPRSNKVVTTKPMGMVSKPFSSPKRDMAGNIDAKKHLTSATLSQKVAGIADKYRGKDVSLEKEWSLRGRHGPKADSIIKAINKARHSGRESDYVKALSAQASDMFKAKNNKYVKRSISKMAVAEPTGEFKPIVFDGISRKASTDKEPWKHVKGDSSKEANMDKISISLPKAGLLAGGGYGYMSEKDDKESRTGKVLKGALLGGVAGIGAKRLFKSKKAVEEAAKKKAKRSGPGKVLAAGVAGGAGLAYYKTREKTAGNFEPEYIKRYGTMQQKVAMTQLGLIDDLEKEAFLRKVIEMGIKPIGPGLKSLGNRLKKAVTPKKRLKSKGELITELKKNPKSKLNPYTT